MPNKNEQVFADLAELYSRMEAEYQRVAAMIGLDCGECQDNCCLSYFKHHTYIEWAFLWQGLKRQSKDKQEKYLLKAKEYLGLAQERLSAGTRPQIMCPLNENGLCSLYQFRLMICRLHGVPNKIHMPNGQVRNFPGCHLCAQKTEGMPNIPTLDRTEFYYQLAELENRFLDNKRKSMPKVNLTLAQMLVKGPPEI